MAIEELLGRLNAKGSRLDGGGAAALGAIRPQDIAAACASLPRGAFLLGLAKYAGQEAAARDLVEELDYVVHNAAEWYRWRDPVPSRGMAELAAFEALDPARCPDCKGVRFNARHRACQRCNGTGLARRMSGRRRAKIVGVPYTTWARTWSGRYHDHIAKVVQDWETMLHRALVRHLYRDA